MLPLTDHATAVLLKEAGFNLETPSFFYDNGEEHSPGYSENFNHEKWANLRIYSRPNLYTVAQWLREVHNLHVNVYIDTDGWYANVCILKPLDCIYNEMFPTHDIALSSAINHCLKIIKERV